MKSLKKKKQNLSAELGRFKLKDKIRKYSEDSIDLLKDKLADKFLNLDLDKNFTKEDYRKDFDKFLERFPVVLSTTHSILNSTKKQYKYDYVIIDESSQVDILTGCLAMSVANNIVIVLKCKFCKPRKG